MYIYIDEFYNNLNKNKKKISVDLVKNTIINLKKYNLHLILSEKIIYFIIYLIKHNCKFKIINIIINNIYIKISHKISKFKKYSIQCRWIKIINIAITNNVGQDILDYFFKLYYLYLDKEKCNNMKFISLQAKNILGLNIKNIRQFKKYFSLNILHTIYYIDIIFSQLSLNYLAINYIFDINL
tara:strand:+ start:1097 stop:1645 length:549 start_codon:yes stop_codon:yes gene_type:complete